MARGALSSQTLLSLLQTYQVDVADTISTTDVRKQAAHESEALPQAAEEQRSLSSIRAC